MKTDQHKLFFFFIATTFIFVFSFSESWSKVTGRCDNCHTMHNSQNGTDWDPNGPNPALLVSNCVGCHSSNTSSLYYDLGGTNVPVVLYTGGTAPTEYLAGGNFWWVKEGLGGEDTKGHNVFLDEEDNNLSEAPGVNAGLSCGGENSCHRNLNQPFFDTVPGLIGRQGCTGCHMLDDESQPGGFHHADDPSPGSVINSFPWYRFLKGHHPAHGVSGIEDTDWEATRDPNDHNEYLGKYQTGGNKSAGFTIISNRTMTAFCCGCHGNFHRQEPSGAWIRHPSDAVLPDEGEYATYTTYDPNVPVSRPDLSGYSGPSNTVTPGTDLVMCLSCHRPHGSPYPDMLRWNYVEMKVGGGGLGGCFVCHTGKN